MKYLIPFLFFLMPFISNGQDDLLDMLGEEEETTEYATATFKGTKIVNMQSSEIPAKGVMQFVILHRFGAINDDYFYNFLGLDNAQIRFSFDYSFTDWLNVGVARSSASKTYESFVKAKILRQSTGKVNMPISLLYYGSFNYSVQKWTDNLPHNETDRMSFVNQLIIARKFSESFSAEIAPTMVHFNYVDTREMNNDLYFIGAGARMKINNRIALTAEYQLGLSDNFYIENGQKMNFNDALSIGVDIETGGHVFQLHLSNSRGLADPQWMARTPGTWGNGDIYLGFNISRVFTLKKPKKVEAPTF